MESSVSTITNSTASSEDAGTSSSYTSQYRAEEGRSIKGKHPCLWYRIPGTLTSYTFTYKQPTTKGYDWYQCQQCKGFKWTGIKFNANVRYNPVYAGKKPKPVWQQQNNVVRARAAEEPEIRDEMIAHFYKKGPVSRKETIRRAIKTNAVEEAPADMLHIPDELRLLPDGSPFVHQMDPAQHIYYNKATIEVFPTATVQGCAFHLAQAWNRKRDKVGITHYLEGRAKEPLVVDWWDTIKGVVFLPRRLHRVVRALTTPPVPEDHPAFAPCEGFLRYLKETWYDNEVFSDLWDKYGVEELRTTNLAEAYHR
ncbi:hypothetical protein OESDEN_21218 [Oesophagostomum dentatum]|uniref:Uncharacterized protein n=1 Tax=Oesophagostomum dentatum TaxID=61180 RepID=A0A0B1S2L2_OESDE|nr:hypothetical protein OESDEN_21218 [Oesophagostomum dentatum]